jgi:anti-sigma factor RsiW
MAANTNHQPNIEHLRDLLSPYLDGEVTDQERALVEQAMITWPELRDELESLRQTVELVASLPQIPAPRPFTLSEADVRAVSPSPRKFFGLPAWASGLAMVAAVLICVLAAGGLFWQTQFSGSRMPAAEIAQFAAEAPAEEPIAEKAVPSTEDKLEKSVEVEEEVVQTVEVEKEVIVEQEAEVAAPAEAPQLEPTKVEDMTAAAPAEEAVDDVGIAGEAETVPEADLDRAAETERSAATGHALTTATPSPLPTAAALPAPATELAEKEGAAAPPAGDEAPEVQPEQKVQIEKNLRPLEIKEQILRITPGLIHLEGTIEVPAGTTLQAALQRNGKPFDNWTDSTSLQTVVQPNGRFSFNIRTDPNQINRDLFTLEPATYQIIVTSSSPDISLIAFVYFDTFSPPAATASPTPTVFPSPTLVTRLTFVPSATPTLRASKTVPTAEQASPRVRLVLGSVVTLVGGLLVTIGLIVWLIIRGRKKS